MLVGKLGNQEIFVCACDDGDVVAYYTSTIQAAINGLELGISEEESAKQYLRPLLLRNIGKSAWGLAIHSNARLIAASCNTHDITVFSFALTEESSPREGSPEPGTVHSVVLHSRDRDTEFTLCGHGFNIPNISFLNADSDKEGLYLASTDLTGLILIWDLRRRLGIKKILPIPSHHLPDPRSGWSVVCVDPKSARPARSTQELLGCRLHSEERGFVDITGSRMTLRDYPLNQANTTQEEDTRSGSEIIQTLLDPDVVHDVTMEEIQEIIEETEGLANEDIFSTHDEPEIDYEDENDELDLETFTDTDTDTDTDPLDYFLEGNIVTPSEAFQIGYRLMNVRIPEDEGIRTFIRRERERLQIPRATPSLLAEMANDMRSYPIVVFGSQIRSRSEVARSRATRRPVTPPPDPSYRTLLENAPDLLELLRTAPMTERTLPEPIQRTSEIQNQGFRRAAEHPEIRPVEETLPSIQFQLQQLSRQTYSTEHSDPELDIPFAIFHTGVDFANLHRPPFNKTSMVICNDPCHQHLPRNRRWLEQFDRLHLTHYIPDIGIIVTATAAGKAAVFSLTTRGSSGATQTTGKSGKQSSPEEIAMRLDWVIPFASQEDRGELPPKMLIGIATAPLQGLDEAPLPNDTTTPPAASPNKARPKERWRLFLTYEDMTVLSYELWRGATKKDGDRSGTDGVRIF